MSGDDDRVKRPNELVRQDEFVGQSGELVANERELAVVDAPDGALVDGATPQAIATQQSISLKLSSHRGPLPSPDVLARYEEILPGAADRILKMAEAEGNHRRSLQKCDLEAGIATQKRGQWFGISAFTAVLGCGVFLLLIGIPAVGIAAVITALSSLVGATVWNKLEERKQRKLQEREQKTLEDAVKKAEPKKAEPAAKPQSKPPKKKKTRR